MKKIISVVLALTMIMMLGVCAFAADITGPKDKPASQTGDTVVKTAFEDGKTAEDYESYTVKIPAAINIIWGDTTAKNINYTVTSQLALGAKLKVSATAKDAALMSGTTPLAYEATGLGKVTEFAEINTDAVPATADTLTIKVPSFAGVAVSDTYKTTLTYTVEYVAAA